MDRHAMKLLALAAALLAPLPRPASAQPAAADASAARAAVPDLDVDVAAALRLRDVSGSREKLQEYGEVNEGFVLERLRLRMQGEGPRDFLELGAESAGQDNQSYRLAAGWRWLRVELAYDALPHRFTSGTFLWGGFGTGALRLPDAVQAALEASEQTAAERGPPATDPVTDTTGEDAVQQAIVRGLVEAANGVTFRLDRRRFGAGVEVDLRPGVTAWARVRNENRGGTRVIGTGSYERWSVGSGLTHTQDRFIVLGAELAEPIDYRTFGVDVGAGVQGAAWLANAQYTFTRFRNSDRVVLWDNPFRVTDAAQVGGFDRSRFAMGQLVLPPTSTSHDLTATGAIDLPLHGRLTATASYGIITQDDAFFPYTRNSAVVATDLAGTPVGPAPTAALPAADLGGDVRTLAGTLVASARPVAPVGVTATYRVYRYDGRSDVITFPGYAAFGESAWRRERNDVTAGLDAPVRNEVFDYWRHEADLEADLRLSRLLSVSAELGWEGWRFTHLRLDGLDEYAAGAGIAVKPSRTLSLKARYRYSDRTARGYLQGATAENPEARGLMNFNWSDRTRHLAEARAQLQPSRLVSLGVMGRFVDETYGGKTEGGTVVDAFRFGRTDVTRWIGGVDVGLHPGDRLSVQATYTLESRKEKMANAAKDDGPKATDDFGFADNFAPENYWSSDLDELVHSAGIAVAYQLVPERVVLGAGYNLSLSDLDVKTSNPRGVSATTLANAVAQDWPTIRNRLHEAYADLSYAFSRGVRAGVRYVLESYDLEDFAWDGMTPYMAGRSVENSTRFVFTDATYGGYRAHVGAAYVVGSF